MTMLAKAKQLNWGAFSLYVVLVGALIYAFNLYSEYKLVNDALERYQIAKAANEPLTICAASSAVKAAYLYVKDQDNYLRWQPIEEKDCFRRL